MQKAHDKQIYLDYASTTPVRKEIIQDAQKIMMQYFENADSLHKGGQRVSDLVASSRNTLAKMLGVLPHELIFTSGASESNSAAVKGIAFANQNKGKHILSLPVEHSSILGALEQLKDSFGFEVEFLNVDHKGNVDLEDLKQKLRKDTILVTCMAVNNEVGTIYPVSSIAQIVKKHSSAFIHVDGVQAMARHDFSMQSIDSASFSAHKIGGLKGSGLWIKKAGIPCLPLINGGQQQFGMRGGTIENTSAILWAKTYRLALEEMKENKAKVEKISEYLYNTFENQEHIIIHSHREGSPYIFNMSVVSVGSEIMMNGLNAKGFAVSAQSTCNSKSIKGSHVLRAMGVSEAVALTSIRISISNTTQLEDIQAITKEIMEIKKYVNHAL